ncbi:MAG: VOC family protein [Anaerolineaceae bacterium]|nr:VOC family protein [Anaerolineaceae bacterium]MCY4107251.1 VOC family protein [Chloroflexota bacterium]
MPSLSGVTIAVRRWDAMRAFYAATLGLEWEEVELAPGVRILRACCGNAVIQLCLASVAGVSATDFRHQLRFTVPDLVAALAAGEAQGGRLQGEPVEQDGQRFAALRDPDDNTLELVQER